METLVFGFCWIACLGLSYTLGWSDGYKKCQKNSRKRKRVKNVNQR